MIPKEHEYHKLVRLGKGTRERTICVDCNKTIEDTKIYRVKIYLDFNDWWIGYYKGPNHHYVCPLPTLVIRWRKVTKNV